MKIKLFMKFLLAIILLHSMNGLAMKHSKVGEACFECKLSHSSCDDEKPCNNCKIRDKKCILLAENKEFLGPPPQKRKKNADKILRACEGCNKAHTRCGDTRPCHRCTTKNIKCISGTRPPLKKQKKGNRSPTSASDNLRHTPQNSTSTMNNNAIGSWDASHKGQFVYGSHFGSNIFESQSFQNNANSETNSQIIRNPENIETYPCCGINYMHGSEKFSDNVDNYIKVDQEKLTMEPKQPLEKPDLQLFQDIIYGSSSGQNPVPRCHTDNTSPNYSLESLISEFLSEDKELSQGQPPNSH